MILTLDYVEENFNKLPLSFRNQFIEQIGEKVKRDFKGVIPLSKIHFDIQSNNIARNNNISYGCNFCSIRHWGAGELFSGLILFWKAKDNSVEVLSDNNYQGEIVFSFDNYPSDSMLKQSLKNHVEFLSILETEQKIASKYKFKLYQTPIQGFDISLTIKTDVAEKLITSFIDISVYEFNQKFIDNEINYLKLKKIRKGYIDYFIDLGSAGKVGLEYILNALNDSAFKITLISIS
jgi:hypothetical protein